MEICKKFVIVNLKQNENPKEKEFKLGSGNTMSWIEYKEEVLKCILVCSNCHKEIHSC